MTQVKTAVKRDPGLYEAWLNIGGSPIADPADWDHIMENHFGIWNDEKEFAWAYVENHFDDIPEHLHCYFDCEKYARYLFSTDFVSAYDNAGNMHVFSKNF